MDSLLGWISQYGYAGLFGLLVLGIVGLPIPDETLLVFSGSLISQGHLDPALTFIAAFAGSTGGISLSYCLGRFLGHGFVHRYGKYVHLTDQRIEQVNRWFHRMGHWLLTFGYYIPAVRHFTAFVAGMSGLEYRVFAAYAYPGAAIWISTFLGLGYFVGEKWREAFALVHRYLLGSMVAALVVIGLVWWFRRKKHTADS
jgi:membrane protein DedA with SNARE-associated domain